MQWKRQKSLFGASDEIILTFAVCARRLLYVIAPAPTFIAPRSIFICTVFTCFYQLKGFSSVFALRTAVLLLIFFSISAAVFNRAPLNGRWEEIFLQYCCFYSKSVPHVKQKTYMKTVWVCVCVYVCAPTLWVLKMYSTSNRLKISPQHSTEVQQWTLSKQRIDVSRYFTMIHHINKRKCRDVVVITCDTENDVTNKWSIDAER